MCSTKLVLILVLLYHLCCTATAEESSAKIDDAEQPKKVEEMGDEAGFGGGNLEKEETGSQANGDTDGMSDMGEETNGGDDFLGEKPATEEPTEQDPSNNDDPFAGAGVGGSGNGPNGPNKSPSGDDGLAKHSEEHSSEEFMTSAEVHNYAQTAGIVEKDTPKPTEHHEVQALREKVDHHKKATRAKQQAAHFGIEHPHTNTPAHKISKEALKQLRGKIAAHKEQNPDHMPPHAHVIANAKRAGVLPKAAEGPAAHEHDKIEALHKQTEAKKKENKKTHGGAGHIDSAEAKKIRAAHEALGHKTPAVGPDGKHTQKQLRVMRGQVHGHNAAHPKGAAQKSGH